MINNCRRRRVTWRLRHQSIKWDEFSFQSNEHTAALRRWKERKKFVFERWKKRGGGTWKNNTTTTSRTRIWKRRWSSQDSGNWIPLAFNRLSPSFSFWMQRFEKLESGVSIGCDANAIASCNLRVSPTSVELREPSRRLLLLLLRADTPNKGVTMTLSTRLCVRACVLINSRAFFSFFCFSFYIQLFLTPFHSQFTLVTVYYFTLFPHTFQSSRASTHALTHSNLF